MAPLRPAKVTPVWVVLVLATGLSALVFEFEDGKVWATSAILVLAALKIALIMNYFMEVATAPPSLKFACAVWLFAVLAIVLVGFGST